MINRSTSEGHSDPESEAIVALLTNLQHVHPHLSVGDVMHRSTVEIGCCPEAVKRALDWLNVDPKQTVGRLRRGELLQLAYAAYRFWRRTVPADVSKRA